MSAPATGVVRATLNGGSERPLIALLGRLGGVSMLAKSDCASCIAAWCESGEWLWSGKMGEVSCECVPCELRQPRLAGEPKRSPLGEPVAEERPGLVRGVLSEYVAASGAAVSSPVSTGVVSSGSLN